MTDITLVEAITLALAYEMEHDSTVVVLGEDVGLDGGVFRATNGLLQKFGKERVLDTPLAESMIAGMSVGMAAFGLKPVAEFQFMGFIYPAFDQIVSHVSRLRNRTRGRLSCPLVFRTPYGAGIHAPEHHSESTEAFFVHTPGLRVVVPSSPYRAYGLLLASIRDPDPVIFLEPARLYRYAKQEVKNDGKALPLDTCFLLSEGSDMTLIAWGAMIKEAWEAVNEAKQHGIQVELIDVATLKPLDIQTILTSVEKTGRCVIVHEAPLTCGVGAEIAALITEKALFSLKAAPIRVTGFDTIVPYAKMEDLYIPSKRRIMNAIHQLMEYA